MPQPHPAGDAGRGPLIREFLVWPLACLETRKPFPGGSPALEGVNIRREFSQHWLAAENGQALRRQDPKAQRGQGCQGGTKSGRCEEQRGKIQKESSCPLRAFVASWLLFLFFSGVCKKVSLAVAIVNAVHCWYNLEATAGRRAPPDPRTPVSATSHAIAEGGRRHDHPRGRAPIV
jgi:hypothetical protein